MAPANTTITSAEMFATPIPNCKVEGYITATNPGPNRTNFRVQLPERRLWNHRFYYMGLGGAAGQTPPAPPNILGSGFVVAVSDTGHQADMLDWSFMTDKVKALDHIHRGAHLATVAAQQITRAYYAGEKFFRYHVGCSGGGRMGMEALRHHPEDYDGILVGGAGMSPKSGIANGGMLKFVQVSQEQPRPGGWVSPAKLKMIEQHVTAECDETDGARDGVVWDSRLCHYNVKKLRCAKSDGRDCLTDAEIRSFTAVNRGPYSQSGQKLTEGMPISNTSMWMFNGATPPPWSASSTVENLRTAAAAYVITSTMAQGMISPDYNVLKDMDWSPRALARWDRAFALAGFNVRTVPGDFIEFKNLGGRVIQYSGSSDPCCSYIEMEHGYDELTDTYGDDETAKFFALYSIPGMGHCGGGTGPQDSTDTLFTALIDWVENGKQPGGVVTHRGDRVQTPFRIMTTTAEAGVPLSPYSGQSRDFLLCPYPQVPVFDRSKADQPDAVWNAKNWSCRAKRS